MVQHLLALGPAFLVLAFYLVGVLNWPRQRTWARTIACTAVLALALRYMIWRFTATVLQQPFDGSAASMWIYFIFLIECFAFIEAAFFMVTMSRYVDRSTEADRLESNLFSRGRDWLPTVDIFIPTYNEPLSVLERTIVGACALDYPKEKLNIYVLDDGRREWLRKFCEEEGVIHVTRPDNADAKAGNLNHGLSLSRGEFVAVFDADFVPFRIFLRRTLGFFADPRIGIVQTPQHFFNKDPIQSNLSLEEYWPDEQRLFFDEMAASRDAWNVSFCCGSCAVLRREAIEAAGGIPTESITEDLLTTLACLNKGYITRYLNERLSMGLAAEDLEGFFIQRSRWCRGAIQSLYVKSGPIRGPGLTLFQRIMFLPVSWLLQYFVRFVGIIVPAVFLWTGLSPLYFTGVDDILYYQVPVLVAYFLFIRWLAPNRYLPVISTAVGVFATFRLLPVVISSLIRPFGVPFRVTPKGVEGQARFDTYTFSCIMTILIVTAAGLFLNVVPEWAPAKNFEFSSIAKYWAALSILILLVAALMCFEAPRSEHQRFAADEQAQLVLGDRAIPVRLVAIAMDESTAQTTADLSSSVGQLATLTVSDVAPFAAKIEMRDRRDNGRELILVHQPLAPDIRDQLIVKLYTGGYSQDIEALKFGRIIDRLWGRAFGDVPQHAAIPAAHPKMPG
ncbi:glycosyltransferase [Pseudolabrys sp. FHR47]|uniref:glycosyltransferase family 2 protein n=1 Tax=Pseudolabrys sp. FHR47 TaxID=2562284 RepID=UPI0010BE26FD|nr:cellulose synthase catalytic subunit [Pseudolabrys sp. FHR47]